MFFHLLVWLLFFVFFSVPLRSFKFILLTFVSHLQTFIRFPLMAFSSLFSYLSCFFFFCHSLLLVFLIFCSFAFIQNSLFSQFPFLYLPSVHSLPLLLLFISPSLPPLLISLFFSLLRSSTFAFIQIHSPRNSLILIFLAFATLIFFPSLLPTLISFLFSLIYIPLSPSSLIYSLFSLLLFSAAPQPVTQAAPKVSSTQEFITKLPTLLLAFEVSFTCHCSTSPSLS